MIYEAIERLIDYAVKRNIITLPDAVFVRNRLLDLLGLTSYDSCQADSGDMEIDEILSPLIDYAVEKGIIADTGASRDLFDTRVMGLLMPMPREVMERFDERYDISPDFATQWYYRFSQDVNYVRAGRIKKDLVWQYESEVRFVAEIENCKANIAKQHDSRGNFDYACVTFPSNVIKKVFFGCSADRNAVMDLCKDLKCKNKFSNVSFFQMELDLKDYNVMYNEI